ncbi:Glycoside catalytic domain protein [Rutstroemia sp. NJR-2017a WRK4]|nr:Glycoside catalytic domain protein [Rutstroemia sp. NJR-2017a WRK4]
MATTFTYFPRLPVELRRKVWNFCIPEGRVMEFDRPDPDDLGNTCEIWPTSHDNEKQPCLSRICRESREVAYEKGGFLRTMKQFETLREYGAFNKSQNPWFYPKTDIVHLNWDYCYEASWSSNRNPVPYFLMLARGAQGASIMAPLLQSFERIYGYVSGHPIGLDHESLSYLDGMNEYRVTLLVVNIHATEAQVMESGLFESLASPIQLVDTSDDATIQRMYKLWRSTFQDDEYNHDDISGDRHAELKYVSDGMVFSKGDFDARVRRWQEQVERTWLWHKWEKNIRENTMDTIESPEKVWIKPNFLGSWDTMDTEPEDSPYYGIEVMPDYDGGMPEYDFNKSHPWAQAVLDNMPRFRPTIMFRHCPYSCYRK